MDNYDFLGDVYMLLNWFVVLFLVIDDYVYWLIYSFDDDLTLLWNRYLTYW